MPRPSKYRKDPRSVEGIQVNCKQYRRITKGKFKWQLLHRRVMAQMLERTHPLTLAVLGIQLDNHGTLWEIPTRYDVHHIDFNKVNDVPQNLMLLDHAIHGLAFINGKGRKK